MVVISLAEIIQFYGYLIKARAGLPGYGNLSEMQYKHIDLRDNRRRNGNCQDIWPQPGWRRRSALVSLFSRERRANQGIVAVEFALIAPVFLYLLMGILEVSIMFLATTVVDGATYAAARKIRTGEAQLSGDATTTFQTELCAELVGVYNCDDITLDVRTFSSFSTVTIPDIKINGDGDLVFDDGDDDDTNDVLYVTEFTTGGSGDIVVARVIYSWEFATPFIGVLFADNGTAKFLSTTAVFRSEPYN